MRGVDEKSQTILNAIRRKIRPYQERDICSATKLSKTVVRKRLKQLVDAGLAVEVWKGVRPDAYYELPR
jgi:DNA-binding Lrp family transcriptional regulator